MKETGDIPIKGFGLKNKEKIANEKLEAAAEN